MTVTKSLLALLGTLLFQVLQAQSDEQVKAFAIKYANRYCSNAAEILKSEKARIIALYMDHEAKQIDIGNFGTAVHEGLHNYDWDLASEAAKATPVWNDRFKSYFVNTDLVISTEEKSVFKTATLHRGYFPQAVKEMSRYQTYIQAWGENISNENSKLSKGELAAYGVKELRPGEARTTSNVKGIYGLLEEFNAYHHGIKAEYELITGMDDPKVNGSTNSVAAYFEFSLFMAYYLKYAKEREREVYQLLMDDRNLRIAYTLIELSWRELITDIYNHDLTTRYFMYWRGEHELLTDELRGILDQFMIPIRDLGKYEAYAQSKQYASDIKALVVRKIEEDENDAGSWSYDSDVENDWNDWGDEDTDGDWGGWTKVDENGNEETQFKMELESMTEGRHYVVVATESNPLEFIEKLKQYKGQDVSIGIGRDLKNYHFFIGDFVTLQEAKSHLSKHRSKYPGIKIITWK